MKLTLLSSQVIEEKHINQYVPPGIVYGAEQRVKNRLIILKSSTGVHVGKIVEELHAGLADPELLTTVIQVLGNSLVRVVEADDHKPADDTDQYKAESDFFLIYLHDQVR